VLRSYHHRRALLMDAFGAEMTAHCHVHGIPISINHHVFDNDPWYLEEARRMAEDGRFAGLILYENNSFITTNTDGNATVTLNIVEQICTEMQKM
jgi:hypothetical protein